MRVESCSCAADWAIELLLGSEYRAAPGAQQPREHISAGVAAVWAPARRWAMSVRHTRHLRMSAGAISGLAGVVLDGPGARRADRPSLTAFSRVLGDDASASPVSSPTGRGALEQLQRKPHRAGIGGDSRRWFRTGHSRERYHEPMNRDMVTVRCDRMGILSTDPQIEPSIIVSSGLFLGSRIGHSRYPRRQNASRHWTCDGLQR